MSERTVSRRHFVSRTPGLGAMGLLLLLFLRLTLSSGFGARTASRTTPWHPPTNASLPGTRPLSPLSPLAAASRTTSALFAVGKTGGDVLTTAVDFQQTVLQSDGPIMVFFTAAWCGPCRLSIPVVKEVRKEYSDRVPVVEVNTDDLPEVAMDAGVVSIPTIHIYNKRGQLCDTIVGCVAKAVLRVAVEKVLEEDAL